LKERKLSDEVESNPSPNLE